MDVKTLIELASKKYGTRAGLARAMKKSPSRVSEWASGDQKPDAHEIAFMAECAGLPVLATVAEIESQLDERYASIWREALGKLAAAGVAATMVMTVGMAPDRANAAPSPSQATGHSLYIM